MKLKLYHGTSFENYLRIMKEGFNPKNSTFWCSEDHYIYFYNPKQFIKEGESETKQKSEERARQYASDNAKITAALNKSQSDKVIIFEITIDSKFITPDDSCENMSLACKVNIDDLELSNVSGLYYADFAYNMSLIYLLGMRNNDYINLSLTKYEESLMDALKNCYFEDDYQEVNIYKEG